MSEYVKDAAGEVGRSPCEVVEVLKDNGQAPLVGDLDVSQAVTQGIEIATVEVGEPESRLEVIVRRDIGAPSAGLHATNVESLGNESL